MACGPCWAPFWPGSGYTVFALALIGRDSLVTQNIYDDAEFFEQYSRLERSIEGLDGAVEWPSMRALLPDLRGLSVLDLGCGYGWFCR